jgi:hypothetical protein
MLEEIMGMFLGELASASSIILILVFIVFVIIAFKLFKTLIKGIMVSVVAAIFPLVALYFEIPLPGFFASMGLLERMVWFGVLGLALFLIYSTISGVASIMKIVTWPFRKLFSGSPKEKRKKED